MSEPAPTRNTERVVMTGPGAGYVQPGDEERHQFVAMTVDARVNLVSASCACAHVVTGDLPDGRIPHVRADFALALVDEIREHVRASVCLTAADSDSPIGYNRHDVDNDHNPVCGRCYRRLDQ